MAKLKLTSEQEVLFNSMTSKLQQECAMAFIANGYENKTKSYLTACKRLNKKPSKNPDTSGSEILNYPSVTAFIDSVRIVAAESVNIDAAWVLSSAKKVFDRCMQFEKVRDKSGEPVLDADGNAMYKFEPSAANKSLEIIGKHISVNAFAKEAEKTSDTLADSVNKLIDKLPN